MFIVINPSEPNKKREIKLSYETDENGEMSISLDATGFEETPEAIASYLAATIACLADPELFDK